MSSIVVADAGPLHYLVLIDCGEILGKLFDHVLVPFAVRDELIHPRAPQKVKDWIVQARPWLEITAVTQVHPVRGLHKGETTGPIASIYTASNGIKFYVLTEADRTTTTVLLPEEY